jgi:acetyl-CoA carboxylase carboxyltransferase component
MSDAGRVFVTGPDVVRTVTDETIDMTGLGGPQAHGPKSGVVHLTVDGGRSVGVIANNPLRKGGCLDSPSADIPL